MKYPQDYWQTPRLILDRVDEFWPEGWHDPCPPVNSLGTPDAFQYKWPERCFINPPFSEYKKWARYGRLQPLEQIWVCNHDHSTEWMQTLLPGATLCLLYKRARFIHPEIGQPGESPAKPTTLIYRGNRDTDFARIFLGIGSIFLGVNA